MTDQEYQCRCALGLPVYHGFDYLAEAQNPPLAGSRVLLPFGSGRKLGVVLDLSLQKSTGRKLKPIEQLLDQTPLLSSHMLQLAQWIADYYMQPIGEVAIQCLPRYCRQPQALRDTRVQCWRLDDSASEETIESLKSRAPRQYEILQALNDVPAGLDAAGLRKLNESWHQPIKRLQEAGLVYTDWREAGSMVDSEKQSAPLLTDEQQRVLDAIADADDDFVVNVLEGVTGSGKTEVYLSLMQQAIKHRQQVIYLVPEIGLTPQLSERLRQRLGDQVVTMHSDLSDWQQYQAWDRFRRGAAAVMMGTRSALFAESNNLGLIIIDEEHDASYRQQDGVRYHARDVAIKRSQMLGIPIMLGSATPSLETLHNLDKPHYRHHRLTQRVNRSRPPAIELVDCSQRALDCGCSQPLLQAIEEHLDSGDQVLLFLNRRGYAPVVMCHDCGWQAECHQCDARLTLHQSINRLVCHHCGYSQPVDDECPKCHSSPIRHYGIGTEQLEHFIRQRFEGRRIIRIDRDSVGSSATNNLEAHLKPVLDGEPCILIGTQMLAKGHDYPNITLVGVLDADQALFSSFYRASERLVQTVLQVSGRAGRAHKKGRALLQTSFPRHPLMQGLMSLGYQQLADSILAERKAVGFPPYGRAITFTVDALDLEAAMERLQQVRGQIDQQGLIAGVKIVGPIPALMTRRIGRYRAQLSLISPKLSSLRHQLDRIWPFVQSLKNTATIKLVVEVDPTDL